MVHAQKKTKLQFTFAASLLLLFSGQLFAQQDPPSRVARLNYINGNVSMEPAGVDEWAPAELNRPFTIGDYLYADQGATAELHLDTGVIRIGSQTSFGFLNLDDRTVQLKLTEGDMYIRVRNFSSDQIFEVDTPNAAVTLLQNGIYRFRVDANGSMSFVVVRSGQAQVTGGGQAFTLNEDNSATLNGTDQLAYDIEAAPVEDEFDQWCGTRDAHENSSRSARYVAPDVVGYEDLDDYGDWQNNGQYGAVWYPRRVDSGWAPYHNGRWAWVDPWGWTWVDSQPWGFAPFHYGRWAYIQNRWGWCPGPISPVYGGGPRIRAYYAPAMVAWFGGAHWGVGISLGGGPSLGWVPLGYGEVYTPAYQCTPRYFNNVNVNNTRIVKNVNITNVYNNVYVNKQVYNQQYVNERAPNAVMAMPQSAFASGREVRQAAVPVRQAEFAQLRTSGVIAPPVAPTRQSFIAASQGRAVARPSAQVAQRQVIARNAPPPAPAPLAARQAYLQQHAGQPLNIQQMHQSVARPAANVLQAPPARAVVVRPGARVGNPSVAGRTVTGNESNASGSRPATAQFPSGPAERQGQPGVQTARPVQPAPTAPAAHGLPPNMRQPAGSVGVGGPATQPAPDNRYGQRTAPGVQPVPGNRQTAPYQSREANQPTTERGVPPNRQGQQVQERGQPVPVSPAPGAAQPAPSRGQTQVEERPQAPVQHGVPPNRQQQSPAAERSQPAPAPYRRPEVQERSEPTPERSVPAAPARQAEPRQVPQAEPRQAPQERNPYPARSEQRAQPPQPQHQEARPSEAPRERAAPKEDHPKSDKK